MILDKHELSGLIVILILITFLKTVFTLSQILVYCGFLGFIYIYIFFLNGLLLKAALPIKRQVRSEGEKCLTWV